VQQLRKSEAAETRFPLVS